MHLHLLARRFAAALIDGAAAFVLAMILGLSIGPIFAGRTAVALRVGEQDTLWKGALPLVLGVFGEVVYVLPLAVLLILLCEPLAATSPGKQIMGLTLSGPRDGRRPVQALRRRFLVKGAPGMLLIIGILAGSWQVMLAGVIMLGILAAGCAAALVDDGAAWHDRLSGTRVVSRRCDSR